MNSKKKKLKSKKSKSNNIKKGRFKRKSLPKTSKKYIKRTKGKSSKNRKKKSIKIGGSKITGFASDTCKYCCTTNLRSKAVCSKTGDEIKDFCEKCEGIHNIKY